MIVSCLSLVLLAACGGGDDAPSAPKSPTGIRVEALGGKLRVSWSHEGPRSEGFNLYRAQGEGDFVRLTDEPLPAASRSFDDGGVAAGERYRYAVSALGPGGESPLVASSAVAAPPPVDPGPADPPGSARLSVLRGDDSSGTGRVTSDPAGIACDNVSGVGCSATFALGAEVVLRAEAGEGSSFAGWSGPCSGTGTCRLTLQGDTEVSVSFRPELPELSVSVSGEGRVASVPEGIDCGDDCRERYPLGTVVGLRAEPAAGHVFTGWSGACSGAGACSVTLSGGSSVAARFVRATLPAPVIRSFGAAPNPVRTGGEVTLAWEVENAERLVLSGTQGLAPTDVSGERSFRTRVSRDTIFTLAASNADGSATATVAVRIGKAPVIASFSAAPPSIARGGASTLAWSVSGDGPIRLTIGPDVGDVTGEREVRVSPTSTTSYTLTAENAFGVSTRELRLVVKPSYTLTLVGEGEERSRVTSSPAGIACNERCQAAFAEGTQVRLEVEEPSKLERWHRCDGPTVSYLRGLLCDGRGGRTLELTMNRNQHVYAVFKD